MKYVILIAGDGELGPWDKLSPDQQQAAMGQHDAFGKACEEKAGVESVGGEALEEGSMATTLRTTSGEMTVTDGPYSEATEQIGGFYVLEAPDLDTVVELCRILPPNDMEIRPVINFG